jgi:hypothetical protein
MHFGIITINHHRPQILRLFCASINRLRNDIGINFPVICVSEQEDETMCSQYGIGHITYPNEPATEKWNQGMMYLKDLDLDYVIIMGSDDIMSTECLRNIMFEMNNDVDLIVLKTIFVYDTDGKYRGTLKRITTKGFFGVGKTINKRILDAVNWRPWEYSAPRNWGMDSICSRNISEYVKTTAVVEGMIVDCKSQQSLNKFSMFHYNRHGQNEDSTKFFDILSPEEIGILNGIHQVGLPIKFPTLNKRGRTHIR